MQRQQLLWYPFVCRKEQYSFFSALSFILQSIEESWGLGFINPLEERDGVWGEVSGRTRQLLRLPPASSHPNPTADSLSLLFDFSPLISRSRAPLPRRRPPLERRLVRLRFFFIRNWGFAFYSFMHLPCFSPPNIYCGYHANYLRSGLYLAIICSNHCNLL